MILGMLAAAAVPTAVSTATGTAQGIRAEDQQSREATLTTECNLYAYCESDSRKRDQVHGKKVVLHNDKVYLESSSAAREATSYTYAGFFVSYPSDAKPMGLVSMISSSPPAMGWIYVDRETLQVKYGNRTASIEHVHGPWDLTEDEVGVTLEGEELFVAVEEEDDVWAVYFDRKEGDRELPVGTRVLEISLERKSTPK